MGAHRITTYMGTAGCATLLFLHCTFAFHLQPMWSPSSLDRQSARVRVVREACCVQRWRAHTGIEPRSNNDNEKHDEANPSRRSYLSAAAASVLFGVLPAKESAASAPATFLVTGANSGIGEAVAQFLAQQSCNVVLGCRTVEKANTAQDAISKAIPGASLQTIDSALDFADLTTVKPFAQALKRSVPSIQGIVHCAGIDGAPETRTPQGIELHMSTNHLGAFALTAELLPVLRASPHASVIALTSSAALDVNPDWFADLNWKTTAYNKRAAYCLSKACNVLFTDELARREPSLFTAAVDPGPTITQIVRYELPKRAEQRRTMSGAQLQRQAKQLGFRTPSQAAVQTSLLALQQREEALPDMVRGGWYLGIAAPPGAPGPLWTDPLPWRSAENSAKVWRSTAALVQEYISDPAIVA